MRVQQVLPSSAGVVLPDTLSANGTVNAPGAQTNLCSIALPPAGVYQVTALYAITGAVEVAPMNMRLIVGGRTLDLPSGQGVTDATMVFVVPRTTLNGTTHNVTLRSGVAIATASTVYTGTIIAQLLAA